MRCFKNISLASSQAETEIVSLCHHCSLRNKAWRIVLQGFWFIFSKMFHHSYSIQKSLYHTGTPITWVAYSQSSHSAAASLKRGTEPCLRVATFRRGGWSNKLQYIYSVLHVGRGGTSNNLHQTALACAQANWYMWNYGNCGERKIKSPLFWVTHICYS